MLKHVNNNTIAQPCQGETVAFLGGFCVSCRARRALCVRWGVMGVGGVCVCRGSCLRRNDGRGAGMTEGEGLFSCWVSFVGFRFPFCLLGGGRRWRSGTQVQGAGGPPAHPTYVCDGGSGWERKSPGVGGTRPPEGRDGPWSPGVRAHPIRRQVLCRPRGAPCKRGAVSIGCYGPSLWPFHQGGACAG